MAWNVKTREKNKMPSTETEGYSLHRIILRSVCCNIFSKSNLSLANCKRKITATDDGVSVGISVFNLANKSTSMLLSLLLLLLLLLLYLLYGDIYLECLGYIACILSQYDIRMSLKEYDICDWSNSRALWKRQIDFIIVKLFLWVFSEHFTGKQVNNESTVIGRRTLPYLTLYHLYMLLLPYKCN